MPDINMQVFEEAKRNQLVTEVDIQTQVALDDYQVQLSDIANPTQSQDNVVIDRFGEFLPHWNESLDFDTWVKINMEVAGKRLLMLRGNSNVSSRSSITNTMIFGDDFEIGDSVYSASRNAGSSIGFIAACPRVVVVDNGTWLMVYRAKSDGSAPSGHEGQVWIRNSTDDGETWSAGTKLSADAYDALNAEFVKYPNGDIDIFYTRYDNSTSTFHTPNMVSRSTNNGGSWSAFATAPTPLDSEYQTMWQDITIGTDVYLAVNKRNVSTGDYDSILYKTTNNGSTWSKISNITTHSVDGDYVEPGIVYLGSGEFVSVLRSGSKADTLQRRTTDWGANWTTDGYIKNDGSVAASGVGTDVVLHQCRIWNEDINGGDLGYIYMQAALYPGSYPRDMYAYISTDNCASWGTIDAIYTAADCHDSAIVFKSSSSAKYYPGKESGESNTTDDDISISLEETPEKWSTAVNAVLSSEQSYSGTKSVKLTGASAAIETSITHGDDIIIEYQLYRLDDKQIYYGLHGFNGKALFGAIYPAPDIKYYDTAWQDTGINAVTGSWKKFKFQNFVWASNTVDIYYNGIKIKDNAGMRTTSAYDDLFRIREVADDATWYVDNFIVRKYTTTEPSWITNDGEQNIAVVLKSLGRTG